MSHLIFNSAWFVRYCISLSQFVIHFFYSYQTCYLTEFVFTEWDCTNKSLLSQVYTLSATVRTCYSSIQAAGAPLIITPTWNNHLENKLYLFRPADKQLACSLTHTTRQKSKYLHKPKWCKYCIHITGLGIRSSVFRANCSFSEQKWANAQFA